MKICDIEAAAGGGVGIHFSKLWDINIFLLAPQGALSTDPVSHKVTKSVSHSLIPCNQAKQV